jgi:hypothetical protein
MASGRSTSTSQLPAQARRRAEQLIELYEREAYRTYNLALRITGEEGAAARATESAFLRHVASGSTASENERTRLDKATVTTALAEAPRTPQLAGDADPLPKAMAALIPSQRAIIALLSFDQNPQAIAAAIGAPPHTAQSLVTRARESLATELQIEADFVDKRLGEWSLAEPPAGIWERLYPKAHRLLAEREGTPPTQDKATRPGKTKRSGSALATRVFEESPRARRRFAGGLGGRGSTWAFRAAVLAIILVPAAVVALASSGDKGRDNVALSAEGGAVPGTAEYAEDPSHSEGGTTYEALTPKELDQLRLQELEELREYSQAQADKSLSSGERSNAEAEAQELLELARQRLAEAERREQQVAAQEQQQQQQQNPPATPPPGTGTTTTTPVPGTTPTPTPVAPTSKKKKKKRKKGQTTTPPPDSVSSCLFDPDSGQYICPQ